MSQNVCMGIMGVVGKGIESPVLLPFSVRFLQVGITVSQSGEKMQGNKISNEPAARVLSPFSGN